MKSCSLEPYTYSWPLIEDRTLHRCQLESSPYGPVSRQKSTISFGAFGDLESRRPIRLRGTFSDRACGVLRKASTTPPKRSPNHPLVLGDGDPIPSTAEDEPLSGDGASWSANQCWATLSS